MDTRRGASLLLAVTLWPLAARAEQRKPAPVAPMAPPLSARPVALDALQHRLEAAASRTARPLHPSGSGAPARAYRLRGHGVLVVLPPRALPRAERAAGPADRRRVVRMRAPLDAQDQIDFHARFEEFREQAERARADAERQLEEHFAAVARAEFESAATAPRSAAPPRGIAVRIPAPPRAPEPPPAPDAPAAPGPVVPPIPPWEFWVESLPPAFAGEEADRRSPEELLSAVRDALLTALTTRPPALDALGPRDSLSVAIDFVPRRTDRGRERTLVLHVEAKDLQAFTAGRLSEPELRRRITEDRY